MATRDGAQVALQQSLILRPGNAQFIKNLNGRGGSIFGCREGSFFGWHYHAQSGQHDEILSALARMAQQVPTGPYALRHRGMLYRTAAQVSKKYSLSAAIEYLQQAAKIDSKNPTVSLELGKLLRKIGHAKEARESFERALQLNPTLKSAQTELDKLR